MMRRVVAGLIFAFSWIASGIAGPAEEQHFIRSLAFASMIEGWCPLLTIDDEAKHAYMRSIGITEADLINGRLMVPYFDSLIEFQHRWGNSHVAPPVACRVGEEKFGPQGTLWPRLLKPAQ